MIHLANLTQFSQPLSLSCRAFRALSQNTKASPNSQPFDCHDCSKIRYIYLQETSLC